MEEGGCLTDDPNTPTEATPLEKSARRRAAMRWIVMAAAGAAVVGGIALFFLCGLHVKIAVRHYVRQLAGDDEEEAKNAHLRLEGLFSAFFGADSTYVAANRHACLGPWATPYLQEALAKRDKEMTRDICTHLGRTRDPRAFNTLVRVAEDESVFCLDRSVAITSTAFVEHPEAFEYLVSWLERLPNIPERTESKDWGAGHLMEYDLKDNLLAAALIGLGQMTDVRGVALLGDHLSDERPWVRRIAVFGLGALAIDFAEDAIPHLIEATADSDSDVREYANLRLYFLTGIQRSADLETHALWEEWWEGRQQPLKISREVVIERARAHDADEMRRMGFRPDRPGARKMRAAASQARDAFKDAVDDAESLFK